MMTRDVPWLRTKRDNSDLVSSFPPPTSVGNTFVECDVPHKCPESVNELLLLPHPRYSHNLPQIGSSPSGDIYMWVLLFVAS